MEQRDIIQFARILAADVTAVRNWLQFADTLNLDPAETSLWQKCFYMKDTPAYEIFRKILSTWNSNAGDNATIFNLIDIVRTMEWNKLAENLAVLRRQMEDDPYAKYFKRFVGREKEMKKILTYVNRAERRILISGVIGSGKTTFAHCVCSKLFMGGTPTVWLKLPSTQDVKDSVRDLCKTLLLGDVDLSLLYTSPFSVVFNDVISKLSKKWGDWVLFIDDVEIVSEELRYIMECNEKQPSVIVITRFQDLFPTLKHINLGSLSPEESTLFMANVMSRKETHDLVCETIELHPLALHLATAILSEGNEDAETFISYLQILKNDRDVLSVLSAVEWSLQWDYHVEREHNCRILTLLSLVDPCDIEPKFLHSLCHSISSTQWEEVTSVLEHCSKYALLAMDEWGRVTVNKVIQFEIQRKVKNDRQRITEMKSILNSITFTYYEALELCHLCSLCEWTIRFLEGTHGLYHAVSQLLECLVEKQLFSKALNLSRIFLQLTVEPQYDENPELRDAMVNIIKETAKSYRELGCFEDCRLIVEKAKKNTNLFSTQDCLPYAILLREDALTLYDEGKYKEAKQNFQIVLSARESNLQCDPDSPDAKRQMIRARNELANSCRRSEPKEALTIYDKVLRFQKQHFGEDDEDILVAQHGIGRCHYEMKNYEEALNVLLKVYDTRVHLQQQNSWRALETYYWVGLCYSHNGNKEESLKVLKDTYKRLREQKFEGSRTARTKKSINDIEIKTAETKPEAKHFSKKQLELLDLKLEYYRNELDKREDHRCVCQ